MVLTAAVATFAAVPRLARGQAAAPGRDALMREGIELRRHGRNRCTNRRGRSCLRRAAVTGQSAGSGLVGAGTLAGTVMGPTCCANSCGSSAARVVGQYLGDSSMCRSSGHFDVERSLDVAAADANMNVRAHFAAESIANVFGREV